MHDISICDKKVLVKEFGKMARILIDHSNGIEKVTINDIKNYKPKNISLSNSQMLMKDYDYINARNVLSEMIDNIVIELVSKGLYTNIVGFSIGYANNVIKPLNMSKSLDNYTCDYDLILKTILDEYDYMINEKVKIRRIGVYLGNLNKDKIVQLNLFKENKTDEELNRTLNYIKCKYGKNSILRAVSFQMDSLQKTRNVLIGGHNAE